MACIRVNICDMTYDGGRGDKSLIYHRALYKCSLPSPHPPPHPPRLANGCCEHPSTTIGNRLARSRRYLSRDGRSRISRMAHPPSHRNTPCCSIVLLDERIIIANPIVQTQRGNYIYRKKIKFLHFKLDLYNL